jgi:hypothetical protein
MRISDAYRELNRQMHATKNEYGRGGASRAAMVVDCARRFECVSILDYGCGKGDLAQAIYGLFDMREYDPAVLGKDGDPAPADLIACMDVLEHVEPECVDDTLDHMRALTQKAMVAMIHTGAANKHLPDGRNAHLIQQDERWWLPRLWDRWDIKTMQKGLNGLFVIGGVG